MKRRGFLKQGLLTAAAMSPLAAMGFGIRTEAPAERRVTILHSSDVHSRIEPFPMDGGRLQGLGGASRRAALIAQIRSENPDVLLFDSGDFWQGTPYFNLYKGELEVRLMEQMGYDAVTLGNHEFDLGLEALALQLGKAPFAVVNSNYEFTDSSMAGMCKPISIFEKGGIRTGVFGLGIDLQGLVAGSVYRNVLYSDPVERARYYANALVHDMKCDLVVCLSHLGLRYRNDKVSDTVLARNCTNIDIILGGHTHIFLDAPVEERNPDGKPVWISQVGMGGAVLGRIDISIDRQKRCRSCNLRV